MLPAARAAAELALVLGSGGEPEQRLLALPAGTELAAPGADDRLVADLIAPELRTVFRALGDAIAKHVGVDLDAYGVSRRQRLRATEPAAVIAREVAATLGLGEVDVYISSRRANAMVAEPTSPVSLVLGAAIAAGDPREVRFAAGAALTLARMSLSIPARLPPDELDALVQVVLRVIRPDARPAGLDPISSQAEALRRHIPAGLLAELQAVARRVEPPAVDHVALAQALTIAGLRAGWAASGSVLPGLTILAGAVGTNVPGVLAHPIARGLISYALGEAATMERT
jgi:hypothetical protein